MFRGCFVWSGLELAVSGASPAGMKVLAATVNYKTPELTLKAVRTLMPELEGIPSRVVIVENDPRMAHTRGSKPDSSR